MAGVLAGFGVPARPRADVPSPVVIQSATIWTNGPGAGTVVLPHTPLGVLLAFGSDDISVGAYSVVSTGYEWMPSINSVPDNGWKGNTLWIGRRIAAHRDTSVVVTSNGGGGTYQEAGVVELAGLRGELLWTQQGWVTPGTAITFGA